MMLSAQRRVEQIACDGSTIDELVALSQELVAVPLQQHRNASKSGFVNPLLLCSEATAFAIVYRPSAPPQSAACQRLTKNWRRGSAAWKKRNFLTFISEAYITSNITSNK